jgi:site-specific recombinase XerD
MVAAGSRGDTEAGAAVRREKRAERESSADTARGDDSVLTSDEVRRIVESCSDRSATGLRNRALIVVLYRGGLRLGEALRLTEADVDAERRDLLVDRSGGRRRIPLDPGSFRMVEHWVERRRRRGPGPDAPLFCTLAGRALAPSYVRGMLHRLAARADVDKPVSAEALRRSLALELVEEGFPLDTIQAQLGHSAAAVTSRYLVRLAESRGAADLRRRADWLAS